MLKSLFVSDLHGSTHRYKKLLEFIFLEKPDAVFIGGDILPSGFRGESPVDFIEETVISNFLVLKRSMREKYPAVFIILGNDDSKRDENKIIMAEKKGLWSYSHNKKIVFKGRTVFGYSYIPPTPFLLKDWEKYDVSRYVDPGCISPEEGIRTYDQEPEVARNTTIKKDLEKMFSEEDVSDHIMLFHTPPYKTALDRAALDGKFYDSAPLDVHVGSIAVREFIEEKQPFLTLHGHIHESARITGSWRDRIGRTEMFSAAHDGKELAAVVFDIDDPTTAERYLI